MRQLILLITATILLSACSSKEYLYDKVGFDPGEAPGRAYSDPRVNKTAPDYYYRAAPTVPQNYAPPQQQQQYYAPPPSYAYPQQAYVPVQQAPQQYVPAAPGGSRYYSNPYAIPATPYYQQAYDVDQYYVPPSAYYGAENPATSNAPAMRY